MPGTRQTKVGRLLQIILTRGANAFREFIEALVITQQEHIAEMLDPALTRHFKQQEDMEVDAVDDGPGVAPSRESDKSVDEKVSEIRTWY